MTKPLRLAYLASNREVGGAERQMIHLATRLPRDRFAPEFILLSGPTKYMPALAAAGIPSRMAGLASSTKASFPRRLLRPVRVWLSFAAIARGVRYDIVDAWLYPSDIMAAIMRPVSRTPVVISGRRNVDPRGRFGCLERPIGATARRLTDVVVPNSIAAAAFAVAHGVDPAMIRIIRNGVELAESIPADERAARRRAMRVSDDEVLIGCVAHYRAGKGHSVVIEAVASLLRAGLPVKLTLVGEGPMRTVLQRQIRDLGLADRVALHGSDVDPLALYAAFDIVVSGSEREGLPNVLLEAAAASRAIVATAAGGSPEVVIDGRTGLLVPVNDRDALAHALRTLVLDQSLRVRLGQSAQDHVASIFGMDRFVSEFAALYEELAASKRTPNHRGQEIEGARIRL